MYFGSAFWQATDWLDIGVVYKSRTRMTLDGDADSGEILRAGQEAPSGLHAHRQGSLGGQDRGGEQLQEQRGGPAHQDGQQDELGPLGGIPEERADVLGHQRPDGRAQAQHAFQPRAAP